MLLRPAFPCSEPSASAVLVTGTSTGLGRQFAFALAARGYRVFCGVRTAKDAESIRIEAQSRRVDLRPIDLDVTDADLVSAAPARVRESLEGRALVAIVMNAGVQCVGPVERVPVAEVRKAFEVNVFGLLSLVQRLMPLLRERPGGRVVAIGSLASIFAPPLYGPYAATKSALDALVGSLRAELAPSNISVSLIQPGSFRSQIATKQLDQLNPYLRDAAYGPRARGLNALVARAAPRLPDAGWATRAVVHAVEARRPRAKYLVGWDAWAMWVVVHLVPQRLIDWVGTRVLEMAAAYFC